MLPESSGFEVSKIMAEEFPKIKVILYSYGMDASINTRSYIRDGLKLQVVGFLSSRRLESDLSTAIKHTYYTKKEHLLFDPALSSDIPKSIYLDEMLKLTKGFVNLHEMLTSVQYRVFVAMATGSSRASIGKEKICAESALNQHLSEIRSRLAPVRKNREWAFLKGNKLEDQHLPLIGLKLRVPEVVEYYEDQFNITIH